VDQHRALRARQAGAERPQALLEAAPQEPRHFVHDEAEHLIGVVLGHRSPSIYMQVI
jgi:hypothetical protein